MKKRNLKSLNLNKKSISTLVSSVGGRFTVSYGDGCVTIKTESCRFAGNCWIEPTYTQFLC